MLHPVGNLPAHVYWRRRLFFVVLPVIGIALIAWALLSSGGGHSSPSNTASTTTKPSSGPTTTTPPPTRDSGSISVGTTAPSTTAATTTAVKTPVTSAVSSSVAASGKGFCAAQDLTVASGVAHPSFAVNSKPVLYMPVTNVGTTPCKLDVADKHVEWRVYTGDVRVWGSHDCAVQAGSSVVTLVAQQTIRLSITWSGLTSLPGCKGSRLAVQAGTYRLYAYLNGERSAATTFTIKALTGN